MDAPTLFDQPSAATRPVSTSTVPAPAVQETPAAPPPPETVLVVDGNSLTHRAWWGYAERRGGDPVEAGLYGLLALLAGVADIVAASRVVVGFDCREESARKAKFPSYKDGRSEKPEGLDLLLDAAPEFITDDLGGLVMVERGWEADDICGSVAAAAESAGLGCVVATSDKDAFALVSDTTSVLRMKSGLDAAELLGPQEIRRQVGVRPDQYIDFAALRGDKSDNLAGVDGIGPKSAKDLLLVFDHLEDAIADPMRCRSVIGRSRGNALLADWDSADSRTRRNLDLMSIRRDLTVDLEAARPATDPHDLDRNLRQRGLGNLSSRLQLVFAAPTPSLFDGPPPLTDADAPV